LLIAYLQRLPKMMPATPGDAELVRQAHTVQRHHQFIGVALIPSSAVAHL